MITRLFIALVAVMIFAMTARADEASLTSGHAELVIFEADGCSWCERWNEQIGVLYHNTDEARVAPLRRVDLDDERSADLRFVEGVVFTPTFVVIRDGREIGRIVGYPGEEFFWPLLGDVLKKLRHVDETKS